MASGWRFYVYELVNDAGDVQYIGKGSRYRLSAQRRNFGLDGHEVARFKRESDAYAYEVKRIAECKPALNIHKGGNGSRATPIRKPIHRKCQWEKDMDLIGSRVYAARALLQICPRLIDPSKLEQIIRVACG